MLKIPSLILLLLVLFTSFHFRTSQCQELEGVFTIVEQAELADKNITHVPAENLSGNIKLTTLEVLPGTVVSEISERAIENPWWSLSMGPLSHGTTKAPSTDGAVGMMNSPDGTSGIASTESNNPIDELEAITDFVGISVEDFDAIFQVGSVPGEESSLEITLKREEDKMEEGSGHMEKIEEDILVQFNPKETSEEKNTEKNEAEFITVPIIVENHFEKETKTEVIPTISTLDSDTSEEKIKLEISTEISVIEVINGTRVERKLREGEGNSEDLHGLNLILGKNSTVQELDDDDILALASSVNSDFGKDSEELLIENVDRAVVDFEQAAAASEHGANKIMAGQSVESSASAEKFEPVWSEPEVTGLMFDKPVTLKIKIMLNDSIFFAPPDSKIQSEDTIVSITWKSSSPNVNNSLIFGRNDTTCFLALKIINGNQGWWQEVNRFILNISEYDILISNEIKVHLSSIGPTNLESIYKDFIGCPSHSLEWRWTETIFFSILLVIFLIFAFIVLCVFKNWVELKRHKTFVNHILYVE